MTTTNVKRTVKKQAGTASKRMPAPIKAIGEAAVDLEHDIAASLGRELKSLRSMFETMQHDVHGALARVEKALDAAANPKPATNGSTKKANARTTTKAAAKKPLKKAAAKRPVKKAPKR